MLCAPARASRPRVPSGRQGSAKPRAIGHKDRYDCLAGLSVDTAAGAITRAVERAYAQGFTDTQAWVSFTLTLPEAAAIDGSDGVAGSVKLIPIWPRPPSSAGINSSACVRSGQRR